MGMALAKAEAALSATISPEINTNLDMGGFVMLANNLVIFLVLLVVALAYLSCTKCKKECCKHLVTLATLVFLIVGCLFVFSSEWKTTDDEAKRIPFAVPVIAFLLGIAASTLFGALMKCCRSASSSQDNDEEASKATEEAPKANEEAKPSNEEAPKTHDNVSGPVATTNLLPALLTALGLTNVSSNSLGNRKTSGSLANDDESPKAQLIITSSSTKIVYRDPADPEEAA